MIRLANALNLLERCSWGHGEGVLVNNLIAGIQFRHDEMDRAAIGQHAVAVGVAVGLCSGESRQ